MKRIVARLREPSTWAAIAVLLAVVGIEVPTDWAGAMADSIDKAVTGAAGVAALAGICLKENGS